MGIKLKTHFDCDILTVLGKILQRLKDNNEEKEDLIKAIPQMAGDLDEAKLAEFATMLSDHLVNSSIVMSYVENFRIFSD